MTDFPVKPAGWRVLLKPMEVENVTKGGIILTDETMDAKKLAAVVCEVIALGPEAYGDDIKFPSGPWCKLGDLVLIERFAGARFKYAGEEYRILNDDEIICEIADPAEVSGI